MRNVACSQLLIQYRNLLAEALILKVEVGLGVRAEGLRASNEGAEITLCPFNLLSALLLASAHPSRRSRPNRRLHHHALTHVLLLQLEILLGQAERWESRLLLVVSLGFGATASPIPLPHPLLPLALRLKYTQWLRVVSIVSSSSRCFLFGWGVGCETRATVLVHETVFLRAQRNIPSMRHSHHLAAPIVVFLILPTTIIRCFKKELPAIPGCQGVLLLGCEEGKIKE